VRLLPTSFDILVDAGAARAFLELLRTNSSRLTTRSDDQVKTENARAAVPRTRVST
jgi:hypothetical protein